MRAPTHASLDNVLTRSLRDRRLRLAAKPNLEPTWSILQHLQLFNGLCQGLRTATNPRLDISVHSRARISDKIIVRAWSRLATNISRSCSNFFVTIVLRFGVAPNTGSGKSAHPNFAPAADPDRFGFSLAYLSTSEIDTTKLCSSLFIARLAC